ncbi:MAG: 50S ribosomal protein L29 [Porticoccaceae bacterium]|nr:50S ribosomal protein L29 [Porticoccaceae bacterium]
MKASELLEKSIDELNQSLSAELKQQFKLRMQLATGQLTETHLVKLARRNAAKIRTVLNQKAGE